MSDKIILYSKPKYIDNLFVKNQRSLFSYKFKLVLWKKNSISANCIRLSCCMILGESEITILTNMNYTKRLKYNYLIMNNKYVKSILRL
jgi:hypothetical protein